MARRSISRTPLGQRLTQVREALNFPARLQFAEHLGMNAETLGGYERGDSEPDVEFLAMYKQRFSVNLTWLLIGEGEMFERGADGRSGTAIDAELMERLADKVAALFHAAGQKPPQRRIAREAANLYNDLAKAVGDLTDRELVEVTLPMLELEFKRRLDRAAAEPGTGKRSAS